MQLLTANNGDLRRHFQELLIASNMASKIEVVVQHALRTFTKYIKRVPDFSQTDIGELKSLADNLISSDFHHFENLLTTKGLREFMGRKRTSLDYLTVYEDDCVSVGIFLLKEGAKLPIHDHPDMYGIIKVLEGILKVTSYSIIEMDKAVTNSNKHLFYRNPLKVIKHPEIIVGNQDKSCLLTPTDNNIHEVECLVGPAAFLDILSPPYEEGSANEPRVCHYFEEADIKKDNYLRLVQVERSL